MKKLISITAMALSLASVAGFAECASPTMCPDQPDSKACVQSSPPAGSVQFCKCFADAAIHNCHDVFHGSSSLCYGKAGSKNKPNYKSAMSNILTNDGRMISMKSSLKDFCQHFVYPMSGHKISNGDCEWDNAVLFNDSGSQTGACNEKWPS